MVMRFANWTCMPKCCTSHRREWECMRECRVHEAIREYSKFSVHAKSPLCQQPVFVLRKLKRKKYDNGKKSAVGNIWRQGTQVDQCRGPVSPTRAHVRWQFELLARQFYLWSCEANRGTLYPPKTLYLLVCRINRHLGNVQGEEALNILEKSYRR